MLLSTWSSSALEHHVRRHYQSRIYALQHAEDFEVFRKFAFWMWAPSTVDDRYDDLLDLEAFLGTVTGAADVSGYIGHFAADLAHETLDRLPQITCPVLVVHGDQDLITLPAYNQRVAAAIPGAQLIEIEKGGPPGLPPAARCSERRDWQFSPGDVVMLTAAQSGQAGAR